MQSVSIDRYEEIAALKLVGARLTGILMVGAGCISGAASHSSRHPASKGGRHGGRFQMPRKGR